MKNILLSFFCMSFAFANVHAQELPKPELPSPENAFYTYLDNEHISNPSKYKGNVKKVIRTQKEYIAGISSTTVQKTILYVDANGNLEKTEVRDYLYGIEDSKMVTNHLESPKATIKKEGNKTIKIIKSEILENDFEYEPDLKGDDHYVYENDRLVAFYNHNDSISYVYDAKDRLIEIKMFESLVMEEYNDEDDSVTYLRSVFEDKALFKVTYKNGLLTTKEVYDKFGEVIDIYKTTYTYTDANLIEQFQTVYKRYLFDYYDTSIPIETQKYDEFPEVESADSIRKATFEYSAKNKISAYAREVGNEKEAYKITFDVNNRMHIVEGNLQFYQKGNLQNLEVEYEYLYEEKGNPSTIKSYYYSGDEKILHKETTFEIEYY
ncbi:hypothetical protein H2O64_13800 [Kordia sp. YSTF-M3]|uniref:Sugar-binding protein n=1 Tax=Kordia aestuariivivens TaxID=2759037 RepID=A0ABR7QAZ5_9FLAO|nr:hypothetical protein [Kordia aestuariivivens]MBC8755745.1 hypothetical protein [Kordia aestuariivivens]